MSARNHLHGDQIPPPNQLTNRSRQLLRDQVHSTNEKTRLLRIHADNQDKKTICIFWTVLLFSIFLIAVLANYSTPKLYIRQIRNNGNNSNTNCQFPNAPIPFSGTLYCSDFFQQNSTGEILLGWGPANQYALQYLEIIPTSLSTPLTFTVDLNITIYQLKPTFNNTLNKTTMVLGRQMASVTDTLAFDSSKADTLYGPDGNSPVGYSSLISVLTQIEDQPLYISIKFNQTLDRTKISSLISQSYAINSQFTYFTIALRYSFFALSIVAMVLYLIRFLKIPSHKVIVQQKMVAVASVLLLMFNDPFYPITVLKPNGGSAFFSVLFIVNLIVFLFFIWLVSADRIFFDDGKIETDQVTVKKIVFTVVLWLQLIISMMIYTMQQINTAPVLTQKFTRTFTIATVIISITITLAIFYIGYRYVKICMSSQQKLWRSYIFILFSSIFIFALFIIIVSNSLMPYNYSGTAIFIVYGFINIYIYYLQYMYTITFDQAVKLEQNRLDGGGDEQHEVLTDGTIQVVDVSLQDDYINEKEQFHPEQHEQTNAPVKSKNKEKNQFQSFDLE